jgi:putative copper export protein
MTALLFIHLIAIGIWAGCVATETVLELAQDKIPPDKSYLAPLHARIDIAIEIPAILVTLITGSLLLKHAYWDGLLVAKVVLGISAVALNTIAAYLVHKRYRCLQAADQIGYAKYNLLHGRIGIGCILTISGAIFLGGIRITG